MRSEIAERILKSTPNHIKEKVMAYAEQLSNGMIKGNVKTIYLNTGYIHETEMQITFTTQGICFFDMDMQWFFVEYIYIKEII